MRKLQKKGQLLVYVLFMLVGLGLIFAGAILIPINVLITTEFYNAGELILVSANESVQDVQNAEVREQLTLAMDQALGSVETNVEVNTSLFRYWWVIVVVVFGIVLFIRVRSFIEVGGGAA